MGQEATVRVGGWDLRLRIPAEVDALLEELAARPDDDPDVLDERLPYWAEIWPSAVALAEWILGGTAIPPGASVLEIGCGLGLAGIAAGFEGARVRMTDYLDEAVRAAQENWRLNLDTEPDVRRMDWRNPDRSLRADVLLAADVAYEERAFEPLAAAFEALLHPGGVVLLSEPRRSVARPFIRRLRHAGFAGTSRTVSVEHHGARIPVDLHRLQRAPRPGCTS